MIVTAETLTEQRYHIILTEDEAKKVRLADSMLHEVNNQDATWRSVNHIMNILDASLSAAGCGYEFRDEESPF